MGGRHTVRALSQEVWSSGLVACGRSPGLVSAASAHIDGAES